MKILILFALCEGATLSPRGVGPITIGMSADSVGQVCSVVSQRRMPDDLIVFDVKVGGDTIRALATRGRIVSIEVESASLRTSDSIGVGSSAAMVLDLPDVTGEPGDRNDTFALWTPSGPHCGITFWLDPRSAEMLNAARGDRLRLLGMRGGTVSRIEIRGLCRDR